MADLYGILGVRLKDWNGSIVSHQLYVKVADTVTLAQVVTDAQAYFALLDPLTACAGVTAHFILQFASTGLKTGTPTEKTEIDTTGLFSFAQYLSAYKAAEDVPAIAQDKVLNGKIKVGDEDVAAWTGWITANGTHLAVVSKAHVKLDAFLSCQQATRKHRKPLVKVSYQPAP